MLSCTTYGILTFQHQWLAKIAQFRWTYVLLARAREQSTLCYRCSIDAITDRNQTTPVRENRSVDTHFDSFDSSFCTLFFSFSLCECYIQFLLMFLPRPVSETNEQTNQRTNETTNTVPIRWAETGCIRNRLSLASNWMETPFFR